MKTQRLSTTPAAEAGAVAAADGEGAREKMTAEENGKTIEEFEASFEKAAKEAYRQIRERSSTVAELEGNIGSVFRAIAYTNPDLAGTLNIHLTRLLDKDKLGIKLTDLASRIEKVAHGKYEGSNQGVEHG